MRYGEQIGLKFNTDGTPCRYPGNTVIADVTPGNPAYDVMLRLRSLLEQSPLCAHYILLPQDSYHMTVIRGLNDAVRTDAFWPETLCKDAPMAAVDAHVAGAVCSVPNPGKMAMAFDSVRFDGADVRVRLRPRDEAQHQILRSYRDAVADKLGLRLPGHDAYTYHLTLAYTLTIPEPSGRLDQLTASMDDILRAQPAFFVDAPYMAYYDDMVYFSHEPLARA